MRYALIQAERGVLSVERASHLLKVSASGYYAWQQGQRQPEKPNPDAALLAEIRVVFEESRGTLAARV